MAGQGRTDGQTGRRAIAQRRLDAAVEGIRGTVSFNAPLKEYTSFRIGGPADVLVEPADVEDVARLVRQTAAQKLPLFVVGGTNLLIRDKGIKGVVVNLGTLRAIREEPGAVLYAEGGVGMPTLIGYAIRHALAGLEWAAGIPGTVAGCVVMNAGTRLGEMKDAVKAVRLVNRKGEIVEIPASEIPFAYRRAALPAGVVVGVWMQLKAGVRAEVEKVVKDYLHYRRDTQPLALPSAGCVFKNPPKDSAGARYRFGGAQRRPGRRCAGLGQACELYCEPRAGEREGCAGADSESPGGGGEKDGCETGIGTQGGRTGVSEERSWRIGGCSRKSKSEC
jgi:UDP-N-acetylmuramate dehydrogenase